VSWKWRAARWAARLVSAEILFVKNDFRRLEVVRANRFDPCGNTLSDAEEISRTNTTDRNGNPSQEVWLTARMSRSRKPKSPAPLPPFL